MGADFIGAFVPMEIKSATEAKAKLKKYSEDYLLSHLMDHHAWDFEEYEEALEWVEEKVDEVYDYYNNSNRETTVFTYDGTDFLVTGGMSWGDDPTDAYEALCVVASLELTRNTDILELYTVESDGTPINFN